ncbi:MAG: hypothetical protein L0K86_05540 [Actinomycetia bacterium]|nr:hypothetical protein [Actinomycetes bacterium]
MAGAMLRIDVLGPLRMHRGSEPVTLGSSRQRRVLARLSIDRAHPVSAGELTEAGWGADLPQRPAGALHTVVSRIRSALRPDASIELTPAGYVLTGAELDSERFDRLVRVAVMTTDRSEEARALEQALGLWRGRAYEGLDLVAVEPEAERLEEGRLHATERLAELLTAAGSAHAAVTMLRVAADANPFREVTHAALLVALYYAGRVAEALDLYHDFRERLVRDQGLDPSPSLVEVHRRILANDLEPLAGASHAANRSASVLAPWVPGFLAPSTSPFVGRQGDVGTLRAAVSSNRLVTVVGTGGVGKTRLAIEVLPDLAHELGLRFLAVHCEPLSDGVELCAAVATAARVAQSGTDQDQTVAWALDRVPTILLLDGAEGVRSGATDLVEQMMPATATLRVVVTTRLPLGSSHEHLVPVAPLQLDSETGSEAQRLFDASVRRARPDVEFSPADQPDVLEICRLLDGLPLAIELAGARTAALGLAGVRDGLARGVGIIDDATTESRRSLHGIVEWTCNCLDADAASLLGRLAVPPGPVDVSLATYLSPPLSGSSTGAAFDQLVKASLLVPVDTSRQSPRYRMLELVREFAVSRLTDDDLRRARTGLVGWAMELVTDSIDGAQGPDDRTVLDRVETHVANLALAVRLADRDSRVDADTLVGRLALVSSHRLPFAVAHLIRTLGGRETETDGTPSPLAVAAAARAATLTGDFSAGLLLARRAWDAETGDQEVGYLAAHTLAIASLYSGDHAAATAWAERLIAPDRVPAARLSDAHATLALAATYADDLTTARHHAETAQAFAGAAGARAYRAFAAYVAGEVALREGDQSRAHEALRRASRLAVDAGSPFIAALSETALGSLLVRGQEAGEASGLLHKVLSYWNDVGVWPQIWTSLRLIAELCVHNGDHESALVLLQAAHLHPSAPDVTGSDAVRESALIDEARSHLDD